MPPATDAQIAIVAVGAFALGIIIGDYLQSNTRRIVTQESIRVASGSIAVRNSCVDTVYQEELNFARDSQRPRFLQEPHK